jgi:toxin ParE1/3/4
VKLRLTAEALLDLESIGDWIARDNPARAASFIAELEASCQEIASFTEKFLLVPRYENLGIRRKVHGSYLIFYRIGTGKIDIIHILHGARDFAFPASLVDS